MVFVFQISSANWDSIYTCLIYYVFLPILTINNFCIASLCFTLLLNCVFKKTQAMSVVERWNIIATVIRNPSYRASSTSRPYISWENYGLPEFPCLRVQARYKLSQTQISLVPSHVYNYNSRLNEQDITTTTSTLYLRL